MTRLSLNGLVILPALIAALLAFQFPSYLKTAVPKTGQIIDADSGEGVPGAVVFVKGLWHQTGLWQTPAATCVYFDMLVTDAQGNFSVPSHYSKFEIGLPGRDAEHDWTIEVRKNGYVYGDAELPLVFNESGIYSHPPIPWNSAYKNFQWNGLAIQIPSISLRQLDMTLEERVGMFESHGYDPAFGCHFLNEDIHEYLSNLRRSFYLDQEKIVCRSPEASTTNSATVLGLWSLARNRDAFKKEMKDAGLPVPLSTTAHGFVYRLTDVCRSMKAGE